MIHPMRNSVSSLDACATGTIRQLISMARAVQKLINLSVSEKKNFDAVRQGRITYYTSLQTCLRHDDKGEDSRVPLIERTQSKFQQTMQRPTKVRSPVRCAAAAAAADAAVNFVAARDDKKPNKLSRTVAVLQ